MTHDHEEAKVISDRVAVIRDGQVVQSGPYETLTADPATPWVAEFLGIEPRT